MTDVPDADEETRQFADDLLDELHGMEHILARVRCAELLVARDRERDGKRLEAFTTRVRRCLDDIAAEAMASGLLSVTVYSIAQGFVERALGRAR